jgi:hypothetical protein
LFALFFIIGNVLLLFFTPDWSWEFKIYNILAFMGLAIYSVGSQLIAKKYSIRVRHHNFIATIYTYCAIAAAICFFVTVDNPGQRIAMLLSENLLFLSFLSAIVLIPHVLIYHLNLRYGHVFYTQIPIALTWVVTLVFEMLALNISLNIIALISGVFITLAIYFLTKIKRSQDIRESWLAS